MKFQDIYRIHLMQGKAISLPEWSGYWTWSEAEKTILMHLRDGSILDFRDTNDLDYSLQYTFRDDWVVVHDVTLTAHYINRTRQEASS